MNLSGKAKIRSSSLTHGINCEGNLVAFNTDLSTPRPVPAFQHPLNAYGAPGKPSNIHQSFQTMLSQEDNLIKTRAWVGWGQYRDKTIYQFHVF